jgi:hypothetical protein
MDASEFFNTVVKRNYQEFFIQKDDYRLLWNAIISMNTVAEYVAIEQHQYAQVPREVLDGTAKQIRNKDLDDLKFCAEALKHVRKTTSSDKQGAFTITATSTGVSANDRTTWEIGPHDLVDVAQRAFTMPALR